MTDGIAGDRYEKLKALREAGTDVFPARVPKGVPVASVLDAFDERVGETVTVAGRLSQVRDFGKLRFSHLSDRSGSIQIGFQRDDLAEFWPNRKKVESNDLVSITGEVGLTKKGEKWTGTLTLQPAPPGETEADDADMPVEGTRGRDRAVLPGVPHDLPERGS